MNRPLRIDKQVFRAERRVEHTDRHTLGTNVDSDASIFLLYISAQISYPPSIHKFL